MKILQADSNSSINGTSKQATLENVSYQDLAHILGSPNMRNPGEKVYGGWTLVTNNGLATIYSYKDENWKESKTWSIGAKNEAAAKEVKVYIESHMEKSAA